MPFDPAVSQQAADALSNMFDEPAAAEPTEAPAAEPVEGEENTPDAPEGTTVDPGTPAPADSDFEGLDLSSLDPHTVQRIREGFLRRDDYTQKTQGVAPLRKFMEEHQIGEGNLSQLQYAVQLMTALQENPHDVALNLANQLGLSISAEAAAAAAADDGGFEGEEYEDLPDHIKRELAASREASRKVDTFMAAQEQQRQLDQIARKYQQDVDAVRRLHPDYDDDDINVVTALAFVTNGDLQAANILLERHDDRKMSRYLKQKASVPEPIPGAKSLGHAAIPTKIEGFEDMEQVALERMNALLASE